MDEKLMEREDNNASLTMAVGRLNTTLKKYMISNDKISNRIFFLNIILTIATTVGALATLLLFLNSI